MFRCQKCNECVTAKQPQNRVIIKTRTRQDGYTEIEKEIAVCPECYVLTTGLEPKKYVEQEKPVKEQVIPHRRNRNQGGRHHKPQVEVINPLPVAKEQRKGKK